MRSYVTRACVQIAFIITTRMIANTIYVKEYIRIRTSPFRGRVLTYLRVLFKIMIVINIVTNFGGNREPLNCPSYQKYVRFDRRFNPTKHISNIESSIKLNLKNKIRYVFCNSIHISLLSHSSSVLDAKSPNDRIRYDKTTTPVSNKS